MLYTLVLIDTGVASPTEFVIVGNVQTQRNGVDMVPTWEVCIDIEAEKSETPHISVINTGLTELHHSVGAFAIVSNSS